MSIETHFQKYDVDRPDRETDKLFPWILWVEHPRPYYAWRKRYYMLYATVTR